jgi:hypothetical protein
MAQLGPEMDIEAGNLSRALDNNHGQGLEELYKGGKTTFKIYDT